jgi:hypothetical protein
MKYVIISIPFAELAPIIFREDIAHEVAVAGLDKGSVVSAGFCLIGRDTKSGLLVASAFGRSVGLNLDADLDRDTAILTRFINAP